MTDQNRTGRQSCHRGGHVVDVVGNSVPAQLLLAMAGAVAAETQCVAGVASLGEKVEKVLVPAPRGMPGTVNKEKWRGMRFGRWPFLNQFEHWQALDRREWTRGLNLAIPWPPRCLSTKTPSVRSFSVGMPRAHSQST